MIADLQACFSEFSFAPCTGLGTEWVQLGLEGSWNGALLCGYGGGHVAPAQLVPGLEGVTAVPRMRAVPQAARPELYLIVPCNVPKTVRVSEAKMALIPFGYAKRC